MFTRKKWHGCWRMGAFGGWQSEARFCVRDCPERAEGNLICRGKSAGTFAGEKQVPHRAFSPVRNDKSKECRPKCKSKGKSECRSKGKSKECSAAEAAYFFLPILREISSTILGRMSARTLSTMPAMSSGSESFAARASSGLFSAPAATAMAAAS
jgi:hypothetical protein